MAKRFEKAKEYTEKYKSELLPCKVCGNTDVRIVIQGTSGAFVARLKIVTVQKAIQA